jgi:hypothetical protein
LSAWQKRDVSVENNYKIRLGFVYVQYSHHQIPICIWQQFDLDMCKMRVSHEQLGFRASVQEGNHFEGIKTVFC